ncbi:MAG: cytochrome P450 [Sphingorhabdus sp.]
MSRSLPQLQDLEDPTFDAFAVERASRGDADDPYPILQKMLSKGSVHEGSYRALFTDIPDVQIGHLPQYMVLGYDAVRQVLMDPQTFTNREAFLHTLGKSFGRTVTVMDAPEHPHFRKVFQKAFLPQIVRQWGESVVEPVVDDLMRNFVARGSADLVEEYTHHFPFQIIHRQLQLEPEQAPVFHKLAVAQLLSVVGAPQGEESSRKLGVFFQELLNVRRACPGTDLVSHLATVEADGERLPDDVLISFLRQLVNAGGDTTYRASSVLMTCLLNNPDQMDAVRQDRSLLPQAIDEALRWDGPVTSTLRYVAKDTEIDGVRLPKGVILNVVLGSANRDPRKFENPDTFDIFRSRSSQHLAFASGPHVCIGQHLARIEMIRAVEAVFDRLPNLRLDPTAPAPDIRGHLLRVPEHIYVTFDPV